MNIWPSGLPVSAQVAILQSMRCFAALAIACAVLTTVPLVAGNAQRGRTVKGRPAASKPAPKIAAADVICPEPLGTGLRTKASFCFVLAGRDPVEGVLVSIPPHAQATLIFDIHNRHTYSEEEVRAGRGFARYTAAIGVLSMTGTLLGRGAIQTEFRSVKDLFDRIGGGAGPGGAKAVAPLGREQVRISIPPGVDQVSLLGEVLESTTSAGREVATPGRPVAIISNVQVEYIPAPAKRRE
jgi:hypothetical protein